MICQTKFFRALQEAIEKFDYWSKTPWSQLQVFYWVVNKLTGGCIRFQFISSTSNLFNNKWIKCKINAIKRISPGIFRISSSQIFIELIFSQMMKVFDTLSRSFLVPGELSGHQTKFYLSVSFGMIIALRINLNTFLVRI